MADELHGVWGIDIGQAGLKALKLRYDAENEQAVAVAFDYVPHPKILSQPDAIPEELIPQALEKFLSRNDTKGDAIAMSVPGQTALTRFIQLPPVESSKVKEIVKYEAKQQIPFALEDVIWDYQTLGGGMEEGGFMLEAEVGLFAMKKDQVAQHIQPFQDAKLELDLIQVAPLSLYNFLSYDLLGMRKDDEFPGMDEYTIVLDMGADNTTLLVSNGVKIWIRNVPIGGNHFTRALTKEMKLTFAKAEHLKCNATKAPDPRAVFQALRPVFNDYVAEIQRSIGYFSSVNRDAAISRVIGMGNGFRLAGLQKFLQQNLQYDVGRVDVFQGLTGDAVVAAPLFEENILTFAVAYGLALQGLNQTRIHTTLLPTEISTARAIRRKKPWAVVSAASLLLAAATSAAVYANTLHSVEFERWDTSEKKVKALTNKVKKYESAYSAAGGEFNLIQNEADSLVGSLDTREQWLEVYKAIEVCLPKEEVLDFSEKRIELQNRIKLTSITAQKLPDTAGWFNSLSEEDKFVLRDVDKATPPSGEGWLFALSGVHYHNEGQDPDKFRRRSGFFVEDEFVANLVKWEVDQTPVRKLGITHPIISGHVGERRIIYDPKRQIQQFDFAKSDLIEDVTTTTNRRKRSSDRTRRPKRGEPKAKDENVERKREITQYHFTVLFIWKPTPENERQDTDPNPDTPPAADGAEPAAPAPAPQQPPTRISL